MNPLCHKCAPCEIMPDKRCLTWVVIDVVNRERERVVKNNTRDKAEKSLHKTD